MKKLKELKVVTEWKTFEGEGDYIEGRFVAIGERESKFGIQRFLTLDMGDENLINVGITSGLAGYNFEDYLKQYIKIVYKGTALNDRTGRTFKNFKVLVEE